MTEKNKYDIFMMETAMIWSKASYCDRRKVGAVIANENRIISIGYNGTLSGVENNCEEVIVKCEYCDKSVNVDTILKDIDKGEYSIKNYEVICECGKSHIYTKDELCSIKPVTSDLTMHAEQNALMFCSKRGISTDGCTIYITTSPCKVCSKLIAAAGIKEVVYLEEYKDTSGIEFLNRIKIPVRQITL